MFFPILNVGPGSAEFDEITPSNPTIMTEFEHGEPLTRARTTSELKAWNIVLHELSQTDKVTLDTFQRDFTNFGGSSFEWENTQDGNIYSVRFLSPIKFKIVSRGGDSRCPPNLWKAEFVLYGKEAEPMYIRKSENIAVADLGVGADLTDWPLWATPSACSLTKIGILTRGTPAGIDDSNTCVVTIKDEDGNTIVTKTYNTSTQPPDEDYEDLGSLNNEDLANGEHITLSVTQGATANMPEFVIALEYDLDVT